MTPEQKQHAIALVKAWDKTAYGMHADAMAALLQEMVDAHEPKPVARVTGYYAGYLSIATVDGRVLPAGTALYLAQPAPSVPDVDWLSNVIRSVDGRHQLGAGALAEKIREAMLAAAPAPGAEDERTQA